MCIICIKEHILLHRLCTKTETIDSEGNILTPDDVLFLKGKSVLNQSNVGDDVRTAYRSAFFNSSRSGNVSLLESTNREPLVNINDSTAWSGGAEEFMEVGMGKLSR